MVLLTHTFSPMVTGLCKMGWVGRTSGRHLRLIMVHAITKEGSLLARGEKGFPVEKGWFIPKGNGKGKQGKESMDTENTREMLWEAKMATGDHQAAITDKMFWSGLRVPLSRFSKLLS